MKPRFQLSLYPLSGGRLWIVLTKHTFASYGLACIDYDRTTLNAEETSMFWRL